MTRLFSIVAIIVLIAGVAQANPAAWRSEWPETNFAHTSLDDWSEVISGARPGTGSRHRRAEIPARQFRAAHRGP